MPSAPLGQQPNILALGARSTRPKLLFKTWVANTDAIAVTTATGELVRRWVGNGFDPATPLPSVVQATGMSGAKQMEQGTTLLLYPLVRGDDNDVGELIVWEWMEIEDAEGRDPQNLHVQMKRFPVCFATFTACAAVGIANGHVGTGDHFCDTIVIDNNRAIPSYRAQVYGPTTPDDAPVALAVDFGAGALFEVQMRCTTGSPTSVNCLYRTISSS